MPFWSFCSDQKKRVRARLAVKVIAGVMHGAYQPITREIPRIPPAPLCQCGPAAIFFGRRRGFDAGDAMVTC
jgi:hypothetical protein